MYMQPNYEDLKKVVKGDIDYSLETLEKYSRDASIFVVRPQMVVFPKDSNDIKSLVTWVNEQKKVLENKLHITVR